MKKWYNWPYYLLKDIYWRFIPLNCRECYYLSICRTGFWKGRKCLNGCIKLKILRDQGAEADREQYFESLLEYAEMQEKGKGGRA